MGRKIVFQESKEFQAKLKLTDVTGGMARELADALLWQRATKAIQKSVKAAAGTRKYQCKLEEQGWRREGIRFDTAADRSGKGLFRRHHLTLAIEATDEKTKLKCKQHHFMPEQLFSSPGKSLCLPKSGGEGAKLKIEQDLHFDNTKFCASGSLFLKGRQTKVEQLGFFSDGFPGLETLAPAGTPLRKLSHWDETVYDKLVTRIGKVEFEWMLVNRWEHKPCELLESELSFKLAKDLDEDWNRKALACAERLYLALAASGAFQAYPPIFLYADPVGSVDIVPAGR